MRRFFLLAIFSIISLVSSFAQAQPATAPTEPDSLTYKPLAKALLWRISGNGLKVPSYLYGTIHLIDKDQFFLDQETKDAIVEAKEVVFEIDMEEQMKPMAMLMLAPKMLMADHTLGDFMNEEDYAFVQKKIEATGLPVFLLNKMKPMFVSMMIENPNGMSPMEESSDMVSYEMEIMDIAKEQKKLMDGLETASYQMSMFDSIPLQLQADLLVSGLRDTTESGSLENLAKIYIDRDVNSMVKMVDDMGDDLIRDFLLVGRNKNWIPVIEKKIKKQSTFFAVGAGHLGATYGVIHLLRKAGYLVEPIK